MTFGQKIRDSRKQLNNGDGLTLRKLSEISGIDENTLSRFENNKRKPTLEHVIKLAFHLEVSIYYLITCRDKELYEHLIMLERII